MNLKNYAVTLLTLGTLLGINSGCDSASSRPESETQGLGASFFRSHPAPPPVSSSQLRAAVTSIAKRFAAAQLKAATSVLRNPRQLLMEILSLQIVAEGGMPRWQVRSMLANLVDEDRALCGGASCSRVFNLAPLEIEDYLDEMLDKVKKDPRLRDPDHKKIFEMLVASLESDLKVPRKGAPLEKVRFASDAVEEAANRAAHRLDGVTFGELEKITHVEIRRIRSQPYHLDELLLLPHLKTVSLQVWDHSDIQEFLRVAHRIEGLEIAHPFISQATEIRLSDFQGLADLPRLRSIGLTDIKIDRPDLLPKTFPRARYLKISNFTRWTEQIDDQVLAQIAHLPYLRTLALGVLGADQIKNLSFTLPKSIQDVRIVLSSRGNQNCGTLSMMGIFRNAASLTVTRCGITGLSDFGGNVAWRSLKLEQAFYASREAESLKIKLSPELGKLLTFSSNVKKVDLDADSRHELAVRLALRP